MTASSAAVEPPPNAEREDSLRHEGLRALLSHDGTPEDGDLAFDLASGYVDVNISASKYQLFINEPSSQFRHILTSAPAFFLLHTSHAHTATSTYIAFVITTDFSHPYHRSAKS